MAQFIIDDTLKKFVGSATSPEEQVAALFQTLRKHGKQFKEREDDATQDKGDLMASLVSLESSVKRAGLEKRVTAALLKHLPKHKGAGKRRADKRQSFCSLALEHFYGLRRSTISRWTRVIRRFKRDKVKPQEYGKVLRGQGGIEEYLNPGKKVVAKKGRADAPEGEKTDAFSITVSPKVEKALAKLKDGDSAVGAVLQRAGKTVRISLVTRDPAVCNLMVRLMTLGRLQKTSGVNPKSLHPRRLKMDTSMVPATLH